MKRSDMLDLLARQRGRDATPAEVAADRRAREAAEQDAAALRRRIAEREAEMRRNEARYDAERRASHEQSLRDRYEAAGGIAWDEDRDDIVREALRRETLAGPDHLLDRVRRSGAYRRLI